MPPLRMVELGSKIEVGLVERPIRTVLLVLFGKIEQMAVADRIHEDET